MIDLTEIMTKFQGSLSNEICAVIAATRYQSSAADLTWTETGQRRGLFLPR
jgi:hypothetical protein